ncbi:MAG: transmembrane prediction [Verrucomicrobia bacterium]|nr:MAG: transmembrane prediction [Verrucomicrobiota bacterium]
MKGVGLIYAIFPLAAGIVLAQRWREAAPGGDDYYPEFETCRTAREVPWHSTPPPNWTNQVGFEKDAFTFARIRRDRAPYGSWRAGWWWTDFPDSDLNLSFRLQQMTSLKVDPEGRVLNLTDPDLFNYPWIYMVEPGRLLLKDEEVPVLRKYLLNGGVLMADDFWGEVQWKGFYDQVKRVLPGREFIELRMDHPIFHCVFDLKVSKNKLQTPNVWVGEQSQYPDSRYYGVTWEYHDGEQCREMHVRAILDDKDRIMVIATHNTDNGDGWEREGEYEYFFREFAEKRAYPLGINIIFYVMTH